MTKRKGSPDGINKTLHSNWIFLYSGQYHRLSNYPQNQKNIMGKKLLFIVLLLTTISFADGLCVQLCVDCSQNPENATCAKVDQVCGNCPAILDSIQHYEDSLAQVREQDSIAAIARADSLQREQERKDSLKDKEVRKIAEIMQHNCKRDTCTFEVTVSQGQLGHIRAKKGNKKEIPAEPSQENLLPPISEECKNFCGACSIQNEADPICEKVESQCKCLAYAEQEQMLVQKAEEDSINAVKKFLNQMQNALTSARSILDFCERKAQANVCSVMVKVKGELMSITEFKDLAAPPPPAPQPAVTNDTITVVKALAKDTTKKDSSKFKTHPNPYNGISFAFESYLEKEVANYDVQPSKQWGLNLGYFWRWYFYQWGSFQTGVNAVYHQAEYEISREKLQYYGYDYYGWNSVKGKGSIEYKNLMLEVPLQARIGFPLGKAKNVSPFISASFHIRKPVYLWMDYELSLSDYLYYYGKDGSYSDFYAFSDWEFLTFVGFGIEMSRAISFQWQFLPVSIVTNTDAITNYYCDDSDGMTWRLSMDVSW